MPKIGLWGTIGPNCVRIVRKKHARDARDDSALCSMPLLERIPGLWRRQHSFATGRLKKAWHKDLPQLHGHVVQLLRRGCLKFCNCQAGRASSHPTRGGKPEILQLSGRKGFFYPKGGCNRTNQALFDTSLQHVLQKRPAVSR